jgi:hypothetical protein
MNIVYNTYMLININGGLTINMHYTIEKVIYLLEKVLKNKSLMDDSSFNTLSKLCKQLNHLEEVE